MQEEKETKSEKKLEKDVKILLKQKKKTSLSS